MMTIDTMIYIILAISGIATVSLYLNIFCAIKLHNYIEYNHKIEDCNDAVEELHVENMRLIEKVNILKKQALQADSLNQSVQKGIYYEDRDLDNNLKFFNADVYEANIKVQTKDE